MSDAATPTLDWHRVLSPDELPEGRVKTVNAGPHSFALTHYDGRYAALSNRCPHQGGPLGEGSIEKGMLRCPWHGYDYCPLTASRRSATACRRSRSGPRGRRLRRRRAGRAARRARSAT